MANLAVFSDIESAVADVMPLTDKKATNTVNTTPTTHENKLVKNFENFSNLTFLEIAPTAQNTMLKIKTGTKIAENIFAIV